MSVKFKVKQQPYDFAGNGVKKFFARASATSTVDFNSICETISDRSTVTKGDVMAVIEGCIFAMKSALQNGNIVKLGDFGSFRVGIKSESTLTEKEFTAAKIKSAHINFRPGAALDKMLNDLTFQKVAATTPELQEEEEETTGAGSGDETGTDSGTGSGSGNTGEGSGETGSNTEPATNN